MPPTRPQEGAMPPTVPFRGLIVAGMARSYGFGPKWVAR
jgi:hypothetical protein